MFLGLEINITTFCMLDILEHNHKQSEVNFFFVQRERNIFLYYKRNNKPFERNHLLPQVREK